MDILLLIVGLGLILAGANFLTDGSAALAQRFRVPEFIIGLTVVAVGTSTPELVVSVLSAIGGQSDVAIGNVVGSNIFNVFVILGVCALIRPVPLTAGNIRRDIPFGVLVSLLLLALAQDSLLCKGAADRIGRLDGAAMLAMVGCGEYASVRQAAEAIVRVKETVLPDRETAERYAEKYKNFTKFYPALKGVFADKI